MDILLFTIIAVVLICIYFDLSPKKTPECEKASGNSNREVKPKTIEEELNKVDLDGNFKSYMFILKDDYYRLREFDLFGTKAALLWNNGYFDVCVICISSFNKGKPQTYNYNRYYFDTKEWIWTTGLPRGCAAKIKKEIKLIIE
jgi:hypothetical protein